MSYYLRGQQIKYKEDAGPVAFVFSAEETWALVKTRRLDDDLAERLKNQAYGFFAPKLVLKEKNRDIELCQRTYDAISSALAGGLSGSDVALLLSSAEYGLYGPTGAHGGMSDRDLPEDAILHDDYWAARSDVSNDTNSSGCD